MKLVERPLGETLAPGERKRLYSCIVGGISWPAARQGYAVVLGYGRDTDYDPYRVYVLDEATDFDLKELVIQAMLLGIKWAPDQWFGDVDNEAAMNTLYDQQDRYEEAHRGYEGLALSPALVVKDIPEDQLYAYFLPQIKGHLREDRQQLFLKDSEVGRDLQGIDPVDLPDLKLGAHPSIEALSFALLEIKNVHEDSVYLANRDGDYGRHQPRRRDPMEC